ncbi:hypothetical protein CPC08DRAFT_715911, partial [Agrocybe pediades]
MNGPRVLNTLSSTCGNAWDTVPTRTPKQLDYQHPSVASVFNTQQARIAHIRCCQDKHSANEEATAECDSEGENPACSGSIKLLRVLDSAWRLRLISRFIISAQHLNLFLTFGFFSRSC